MGRTFLGMNADGVKNMFGGSGSSGGGSIGSAIAAFAQAPLLRQQAEQDAALKQAQIYANNMHGNKYGADAQGQMLTNSYRVGMDDEIAANPEMPDFERTLRLLFKFAGPGHVNDMASARGSLQKQGYVSQLVNNPTAAPNVATAYMATEGKPLFSNVGSSGVSMNNATGSQSTTHNGLYGLHAGGIQAGIAKDYAQGRNYDAQAQREARPNTEVVQDGNGGVLLVDKRSGQAIPVTNSATGAPVVGKGVAEKALTDSQSKALLFGTRMQEANAIINELGSAGVQTSILGSRLPIVGDAVNAAQGPQHQRLDQAKRDFINAVLRRESGAVISGSEFANAERQYFPQIGDSPQVIAQKGRNREIAIRGMLAEVPNLQTHQAGIVGSGGAPQSSAAAQAAPGGEASGKAQQAPKANYSIGQHLNMARDALRNGAPRAAVEAMLRQNGIDPAKLGK